MQAQQKTENCSYSQQVTEAFLHKKIDQSFLNNIKIHSYHIKLSIDSSMFCKSQHARTNIANVHEDI
jgi:hypothetical protein